MKKAEVRERIAVVLAAIPLAFVLSILMRFFASLFHIETPGLLFLDWYVPGHHSLIGGPALLYDLLVDTVFCLAIVLCLYWFIYKRFYVFNDRE